MPPTVSSGLTKTPTSIYFRVLKIRCSDDRSRWDARPVPTLFPSPELEMRPPEEEVDLSQGAAVNLWNNHMRQTNCKIQMLALVGLDAF